MNVSDFTVDGDVFDTTDMLGGIEMFQIPAVSNKQSESFVILTPENHVVVMDGGRPEDADYLYNFLSRYSMTVDAWFVSHFHIDHIGALLGLLENYDLKIDTLYYDFRGATNEDFVGDSENYAIWGLNDAVAQHPKK